MQNQKILLIGGGGHCKSCIDIIDQLEEYEIVGIIDVAEKIGTSILGYPIVGTDDDIVRYKDKTDVFFISIGQIGTPKRRKEIFTLLKTNNCKLATLVAPLAYVSKYSQIAEGTIIMQGAIVNADAKIGANCIINSRALIEHDVTVEDHCHVSTGAILNGGAHLGADSFYGSGAICKEGVKIKNASFVKANSIFK